MTKKQKATELRVDRVRKALMDDILSGHFAPGAKLDEVSLAARYDVSRTPVREALRHMAAMGLVENRPHRGVTVIQADRQRMAHLCECLAVVEGLCARLAAERMSGEEKSALASVETGEAALGAIRRGGGNPVLASVAEHLRVQLLPYANRLPRDDRGLAQALRAIQTGDGDEAERAMQAHVLSIEAAPPEDDGHGRRTRAA